MEQDPSPSEDTTVPPEVEEVEKEILEYVLTCRVCGAVLCRASELLEDDVNRDPSCGSYFLENPLDWMDEAASTVSFCAPSHHYCK
jgi:hypothetical protein